MVGPVSASRPPAPPASTGRPIAACANQTTTISSASRRPARPAITNSAYVCSVIGTGVIGASAQDEAASSQLPASTTPTRSHIGRPFSQRDSGATRRLWVSDVIAGG